ncbi:MAG: hypothetical protein KTR33_05320 [Gammaproteobacteria bacterium]|nr:hypothetical protein [Gammaproteobacteria bacterium]
MSSAEKLPPWRYRLLLAALSPLLMLHALWRSFKDGGRIYLQQRLGFNLPKINDGALWVHAASVGEVQTATPLIQALGEQYPDTQFLLTTTTPTGYSTLLRLHADHAYVAYLPIDFVTSIRRFYKHLNPTAGIIIETEIWPNLYHLSPVPIAIVNGRLSSRTLRAAQSWGHTVYKQTLQIPELIATRSDTDTTGFISIGASSLSTRTVGNLKFANAADASEALLPLCERPYCLLASTHDDEELQLTRVWFQQRRSELLVIAPRHPERRSAILRQLRPLLQGSDQRIAVRSQNDPIDKNTVIYLADTFGELPNWYAHARAVFIGGSLIERGGHNMLEAAAVGKAVVCGPHTFNFSEEVAALRQHAAMLTGATATECIQNLIRLLDDPDKSHEMGLVARSLLDMHRDIADRYVENLKPVLRHL